MTEDIRQENRRIAEWFEAPLDDVLHFTIEQRAICVVMLPSLTEPPRFPIPGIYRPDCENCHAPASGYLEDHPLCRFCRTQADPKRKYRWEGL